MPKKVDMYLSWALTYIIPFSATLKPHEMSENNVTVFLSSVWDNCQSHMRSE